MSEQTNINQTMTQYLLGSLPAAETERLDELCVSDEEFAMALTAAENELIDAYAQQELAGETLERFKSHYLTSPLRSDKVHFARALHGWVQKSAKVHEETPARTTSDRGSSAFSLLRFFTTPRLSLQWGSAAAALVLLITGGWLVFENTRLRGEVSQTQRIDALGQRQQQLENELALQRGANAATEQELARVRDERERLEQDLNKRAPRPAVEGNVVALILTPPMRGGGQVSTVSLTRGTSLVAVQLQLEAADYSTYRVALIDPGNNQTLWRSGNLKPKTQAARKAISVTFPADLLKPQNYILQVAGISATGGSEIVGDYPFKVVK